MELRRRYPRPGWRLRRHGYGLRRDPLGAQPTAEQGHRDDEREEDDVIPDGEQVPYARLHRHADRELDHGQDRDVLQELRPVLTPETNIHETLVSADGPIARYRERLKEWEAKGWRIDVDEVRRNENKVAYAIPSPARRDSKGWALDPIPLLSGEAALRKAAE